MKIQHRLHLHCLHPRSYGTQIVYAVVNTQNFAMYQKRKRFRMLSNLITASLIQLTKTIHIAKDTWTMGLYFETQKILAL